MMKLVKIITAASCIMLANTAYAACNPDTESKFKDILKRTSSNALPAAGIYYQHDSCSIKLVDGKSNLALETDIQVNDRFNIGSITKTFVAVTSVKLAESNVFGLDDAIQLWLPQSIYNRIPNSDAITIRHLLSHSSGIYDYINDGPQFTEAVLSNQDKLLTELDALKFAFDKPLFFKPGSKYKYSNTNYLLMGLIINQATGKHYTVNIREQILNPLSLNDTFHLSQPAEYLEYVHGYWEDKNILYSSKTLVTKIAFADGHMISSLQDLSTFIQAIFTNKKFISDTTLTTLLSSPVADSRYGLGIEGFDNTGSIYGHSGAEVGYNAYLQFDTKKNETLVQFTTGSDGVMSLLNVVFSLEITRTMILASKKFTLAP